MHRRLSSNIIIEYWECLCKFKFLRRKFLWMKKRNKVRLFRNLEKIRKKKKKEENYIFRLAQVKLKCRTLFLYFSSLSLFFFQWLNVRFKRDETAFNGYYHGTPLVGEVVPLPQSDRFQRTKIFNIHTTFPPGLRLIFELLLVIIVGYDSNNRGLPGVYL